MTTLTAPSRTLSPTASSDVSAASRRNFCVLPAGSPWVLSRTNVPLAPPRSSIVICAPKRSTACRRDTDGWSMFTSLASSRPMVTSVHADKSNVRSSSPDRMTSSSLAKVPSDMLAQHDTCGQAKLPTDAGNGGQMNDLQYFVGSGSTATLSQPEVSRWTWQDDGLN